mmetsp:Transcript_20179/g.63243  ORF Transcript_20179/g.63243 Transcript_20179/m.63243 type:complete len:223 (+) Transcript_20179:470-1138(+)
MVVGMHLPSRASIHSSASSKGEISSSLAQSSSTGQATSLAVAGAGVFGPTSTKASICEASLLLDANSTAMTPPQSLPTRMQRAKPAFSRAPLRAASKSSVPSAELIWRLGRATEAPRSSHPAHTAALHHSSTLSVDEGMPCKQTTSPVLTKACGATLFPVGSTRMHSSSPRSLEPVSTVTTLPPSEAHVCPTSVRDSVAKAEARLLQTLCFSRMKGAAGGPL